MLVISVHSVLPIYLGSVALPQWQPYIYGHTMASAALRCAHMLPAYTQAYFSSLAVLDRVDADPCLFFWYHTGAYSQLHQLRIMHMHDGSHMLHQLLVGVWHKHCAHAGCQL